MFNIVVNNTPCEGLAPLGTEIGIINRQRDDQVRYTKLVPEMLTHSAL